MARNHILVVVHVDALSGVEHAFSLAKRVPATVFVMRVHRSGRDNPRDQWMDEYLRDLVARAQEADVEASYHVAWDLTRKELLDIVKKQHINLLIIGEEGTWLRQRLSCPETGLSFPQCRTIEVKSKETGKKDR